MTSKKRRPSGFSLVELLVVVAIVGIAVSLVVMGFESYRRSSDLKERSRILVADLLRARNLAATGRQATGLQGWTADDRTVQAGVRMISATQYAIFIDRNTVSDSDEIDLEVVDFEQERPGSSVQIDIPAPGEIRFRRNGTLTTTGNVDITLQDTSSSREKVVRVTYGGRARIHL